MAGPESASREVIDDRDSALRPMEEFEQMTDRIRFSFSSL